MGENITGVNISDSQRSQIQTYLEQPSHSKQGDQALEGLLTVATGLTPITRAQIALNQPYLRDSITYVDGLRACNPSPGELTPLDAKPRIKVEIKKALENGQIHPVCFAECPFGVLRHYTGEGDSRIQCSKVREVGSKLVNTPETPKGTYTFEHLADNGLRYILDAIMNGRRIGGLTLTLPYISRLGISRELVFNYPGNSGKGRIVRLGGAGVISVNSSKEMVIDNPNPNISVAEYIKQNLPPDYSGMRTTIILPNGQKQVTINTTPIGAYTIESARRKWDNTLIARDVLAKAGIILPEPLALMVNNSNGLAAIAYSYPSGGREISQVVGENDIAFSEGIKLLGNTLRVLHDANYIHAQPGGNWTIYFDFTQKKFTISLRDFGTMYSIGDYPLRSQKTAKALDLENVLGATLYLVNRSNSQTEKTFVADSVFNLVLGYTGDKRLANSIKTKVGNFKKGYLPRDLEQIFDTIFK